MYNTEKSTVYVLLLSNEKYYVGKTKLLQYRINQHFEGSGSYWTTKYKPIEVLETIEDTGFTELATTLRYMDMYGIDNVRGSDYSTVRLTSDQISDIKNHMRGEKNQCYNCGETHFISQCPSRSILQRIYGFFTCCIRKDRKVPTMNYISIKETDETDILDFGKYKGHSYIDVYRTDPSYCEWCLHTESNYPSMKKFQVWLNKWKQKERKTSS